MSGTEPMRELLATCRALWGGEALVFRAYWRSPTREAATDRAWLARQCHKEIFDGVMPRLTAFDTRLGGRVPAGGGTGPDDLEHALIEAVEEYRHFRLFADVHEALRGPGDLALDFQALRDDWGWPENDALGALRARHRREFGALGALAGLFTEGGGATLYSEGMVLDGSDADRLIAGACRQVYDDEVAHMREGLEGLRDLSLSADQWRTVHEMVTEQLRQRIVMRNAQFGLPLTADEVASAQRGEAEPAGADPVRAS